MPTVRAALKDLREAIGRRADLDPDTLKVLLAEPDPQAAYRAALRRWRTKMRVVPEVDARPVRLARLPFMISGIIAASAALIVDRLAVVAWSFQLLVVSLVILIAAGLIRKSANDSGDGR